MNKQIDTKIEFNKKEKKYIIETTIVETLNQQEMFQNLMYKKQLLGNTISNGKNLKEIKTNMRKFLDEKKNELLKKYKSEMPQVTKVKKLLRQEIKEIEELTINDKLIQEKLNLYEQQIKKIKQRNILLRKEKEIEEKEFEKKMNK